MTEYRFNVEIQADDGKWFIASNGENLSAQAADRMIVKLRAQGFRARGNIIERN